MTKLSDSKIAEKAAEPLKPSAERSKEKGNAHPVKPEDRVPTPTGNTLATDNLQAAYSARNAAENAIKQIEETSKKQEEDALWLRDQKIFEMTRPGGPGLPPGGNVDTGIPLNTPHVIMHSAEDLKNQQEDKNKEVDPAKQAEEDIKKLEEYEKLVQQRKLTAEEETDRALRKSRSEKRNTSKK